MRELVWCIASGALLAACATTPEITQKAIASTTDASPEAFESYTLASSIVTIKKGGDEGLGIDVSVADAEHNVLFQIFHDDPFYQTTTLTITKSPGTNTVSEAGAAVTDYRQSYINFAGTLLKFAGSAGVAHDVSLKKNLTDARLPYSFRVEDVLHQGKANPTGESNDLNWGVPNAVDGVVAGPGVKLSLGPVPPDAVPTRAIVALGRHSFNGIYFSACRDLDIAVNYGNDEYDFHTRIADPYYVTRISFPEGGSITAHKGACGQDTTPAKPPETATSPAEDFATAITKQVQDVESAVSEANKNREAKKKKRKSQKNDNSQNNDSGAGADQ